MQAPQKSSTRKIANLIADVVISVVSDYPRTSRFVVMPVSFAEALCCHHCDYWTNVKTATGKQRSDSFPIYLCLEADLTGKTPADVAHHERVKRNLLKFEDAWYVLSEPFAKLHDPKKWPLLR